MNYIGRNPAPSGVVLVGDSNPVGMIAWFHSPPTGWVRANGAALVKAAYPDLWAYAQGFLTADQVANPGLYRSIDASTFAVPNLDGLFVRSAGQVDVNHVALAIGVKQADQNLAHVHGIDRYNNPGANTNRISGGGALQAAALADDVQSNGGTEARPVNVSLVACVKALATTLAPVQTEVGAYPPGALVGCTLSNNVTDAVNDIDIAAGKCRAAGDVANMTLAAMTKQLDAAWAVGTGAGMRASGAAIADGTYHLFAIRRPDTGVVDVAADTSAVGANIAANTNAAYTQMRRLGSIIRAAGTIVGFVQSGDYFRRKATVLDANLTNPGTAAIIQALSVPLGINVFALFNCFAGAGAVAQVIIFSDLAANDEAPSATLAPVGMLGSGSGNLSYTGEFSIRTNTAAQIRVRSNGSDGSTTIRIATSGWVDARGRNDL